MFSDLPINPLNEAEAVAEKENEMGAEMSADTFETIMGLQEQLAQMLETQENCCKK